MKINLSILMITHFPSIYVFPRSLAMAKCLVKRGHAVSLIAISPTKRIGIAIVDMDGVRVIETPDLLWGKMRVGWDPWDAINRIIFLTRDKVNYDILHLFETRPITIYPALYYRYQHNPVFITDWNDWWGRGGIIQENRPKWYRMLFGGLETYYEEAFRKEADGLTVISTALRDRAIKLGVRPEKIHLITGGAHTKEFKNLPMEECRKQVGLPQDILVIGYSSRDAHYELDMMIRVLAEVVKEIPTACLMLTGNPGHAAKKLAMDYGVSNNLLITGFLPYKELPIYLGCANVFILPFPNKIFNIGRWPNKIGDYLSLGRPLISNPFGDVKLLLDQNDVGLLANWDSVDFADKIISLFHDPKGSYRMGQNARHYAETHLDWNLLVEELEEYYFNLWDEKQRRANGKDTFMKR